MKLKYQFTSSKKPIIVSLLIFIVLVLFILFIHFNSNITGVDFFKCDTFIMHLTLVLIGLCYLFAFFQAFLNAYLISCLDPIAQLEIDNQKQYIVYSNVINGELKKAQANFEDIYLLKYNKAKFINLSYYEVFYKVNDVTKKIIISIALTNNLEKKIDKTIKFVKNEIVFFDEFPKTTY